MYETSHSVFLSECMQTIVLLWRTIVGGYRHFELNGPKLPCLRRCRTKDRWLPA
jgi:hypothetical protein